MCFFVGDLDAFAPDFVRMLQTDVLADYPLWRLLAQFEELEVGVYPTGAWFGEHWVEGRFDEAHPAYRHWLAGARHYRERRFGPLRRQLAYVGRRIPAVTPIARRDGFAFLAAFDKYQPHLTGHPVWLLQSAPDDELSLDVPEAPVRSHAVRTDGVILPRWAETADGSPSYWLVTYLLADTAGREFVMKSAAGTVVGCFVITDVIRDEDLLSAPARLGPEPSGPAPPPR